MLGHLFARTASREHHTMDDVKQQRFIFLVLWELEVQNQGVGKIGFC